MVLPVIKTVIPTIVTEALKRQVVRFSAIAHAGFRLRGVRIQHGGAEHHQTYHSPNV